MNKGDGTRNEDDIRGKMIRRNGVGMDVNDGDDSASLSLSLSSSSSLFSSSSSLPSSLSLSATRKRVHAFTIPHSEIHNDKNNINPNNDLHLSLHDNINDSHSKKEKLSYSIQDSNSTDSTYPFLSIPFPLSSPSFSHTETSAPFVTHRNNGNNPTNISKIQNPNPNSQFSNVSLPLASVSSTTLHSISMSTPDSLPRLSPIDVKMIRMVQNNDNDNDADQHISIPNGHHSSSPSPLPTLSSLSTSSPTSLSYSILSFPTNEKSQFSPSESLLSAPSDISYPLALLSPSVHISSFDEMISMLSRQFSCTLSPSPSSPSDSESSTSTSSSLVSSSSSSPLSLYSCTFSSLCRPLDDEFVSQMWQRETFYQPSIDYLLSHHSPHSPSSPSPPSPSPSRRVIVEGCMRPILYDWLMEISMDYLLSRECFHMAINYIDRFCANVHSPPPSSPPSPLFIDTNNYQLIGITALFIASKLDETRPPSAVELSMTTNGACSPNDLYSMEREMLRVLGWKLQPQTSPQWYKIFIQQITGEAVREIKKITENHHNISSPSLLSVSYQHLDFILSNFLSRDLTLTMMKICDLALLDHNMLGYYPSAIAAAAIVFLLREIPWDQHEIQDNYSYSEPVPSSSSPSPNDPNVFLHLPAYGIPHRFSMSYFIDKIVDISGYPLTVLDDCINIHMKQYINGAEVKEEIKNHIVKGEAWWKVEADTSTIPPTSPKSKTSSSLLSSSSCLPLSPCVVAPAPSSSTSESSYVNIVYPDGTTGDLPRSVYLDCHTVDQLDPLDISIHYEGGVMCWVKKYNDKMGEAMAMEMEKRRKGINIQTQTNTKGNGIGLGMGLTHKEKKK